MVTETIINFLNTYSCQVCGKHFQTKDDFVIIPGHSPLCCRRCKFKLAYRILNEYSNSIIKDTWKIYYPNNPLPKTRNEGIFAITKSFMNGK